MPAPRMIRAGVRILAPSMIRAGVSSPAFLFCILHRVETRIPHSLSHLISHRLVRV